MAAPQTGRTVEAPADGALPPHADPSRTALRVALIYALVAALWILGSDWLLARLIRDPDWLMQAGALKGWLFVALTAALLYALMQRGPRRSWLGSPVAEPLPQACAGGPPWLGRTLVAGLSAAIVALTALMLQLDFKERRTQQLRQIEAVAEQHASQLATWFSYRQSQARLIRSSSFYASLYQRWRGGDGTALAQLMLRVVALREAFGDRTAMVFDEHGTLLAAEQGVVEASPAALREPLRQALATGELRQAAGGDPAIGTAWLDMVVPVLGQASMPRMAVVLRLDLNDFVLPMLRSWPTGTRTGRTVLVRREGDEFIDLFGSHRTAVSTPGLLAARALAAELPTGRAVEGLDPSGVPMVGAVRPVPGTDWLLVAGVDAAELHAESLKGTLWIAATGLMTLLGLGVGTAMLRERRARERAQAQRAAQEERLRALALVQAVTDSVLDHIAVLDRHGVIVKVNAAWTRFAAANGSHPSVGLGMDYLAVCRQATDTCAGEAAAALAGIEAVLAGRRPVFKMEYPCHSPQRRRWFHMTVTPLGIEDGGVVVVHRDITERYEAQAQLRKLSLAVDQSPIGIAIGDTEGHVEYVNGAFTRITGLAREEAIAPWAHALQPQRLPTHRKAALAQALAQGRTWSGEFQNQRRNGERYEELIHAAPIRQDDGRITHHLWIVEDVTEKKRIGAELERHRHRLQELVDERTQQLRQANAELVCARDHADAANQAKSAFLANMSHEIRTPLNAILGLTHLLRRDVDEAVQVERLTRVDDAAGQLLLLVNDLLDHSRIEAGRLELQESDFSLCALLAGSHALVAERAQAKGLTLTVDAGDVPDALRGDPTRLSQALLNLLSNAVKFTERGSIDVRAQVLERDAQGLTLCLRVRDTGIGIAPEKLEQIFDTFVQSDASATRRFGGTGLGLALTRRLAVMMGGQAGVSSEPGVGSEFWFSARVREGQPAPPMAASAGTPGEAEAQTLRRRSAGMHVLLVDDNPVSQGLALEMLRWAGLEVEVADDGVHAVEAARARTHDLILMDVQMPQMDGLEATRRIRALPGRAAVPVVAMTARTHAADRAACLDAGMNDHVPKPVEPPQLFAALLRWLPARTPDAVPAQSAPAQTVDAATATLPAIAGLDVAQALRYLGGQGGLYRRVLEQFQHHYSARLDEARRQLAAGDSRTLAALVHALWGSAEPIGAADLARRARALERTLSDGNPAQTRAAGEALLDELQALLHAIRQGLAGGEAGAAAAESAQPQGGGAVDATQWEQLAQWLHAGDYRAVAHWRALAPALRRDHAAAAAEVDAQLLAFDFEAALQVLQRVRHA